MTDDTHDPALVSWLDSANDPATDFPIQNLPFGVYSSDDERPARIAAAIGDEALDLRACGDAGLLAAAPRPAVEALGATTLNRLMARPASERAALRRAIQRLLDRRHDMRGRVARHLVRQRDVRWRLPADIGDYTDFYASVFHATNVGSMFRPDNPLLPNYKYVPIGYHGRASSIVPSGAAVRRPAGQTRPDGAESPAFGPSARLDYELEVGLFVGAGNRLGEAIPIEAAEERAFGLSLVNDWSARDIQQWEYQPLGPFLAKSFATTLSPWVVPFEALAPFRTASFERPAGDPPPLAYLASERDRASGGIDITLEVLLSSERMRSTGHSPVRLSRGRFADMYWTFAQLLTHHASNGCNLRPGDLLASGTVSGPAETSRGCLLELTWRGAKPIGLPTGETRRFLEDGDEVVLRGWCEREGWRRIGFGECRGVVAPARSV